MLCFLTTCPYYKDMEDMKFSVEYAGKTMECVVFNRHLPFHHALVLTGTVDGQCRMESNVSALARLKPETFQRRVREAALARLADISEMVRFDGRERVNRGNGEPVRLADVNKL